MIRRFSNVSRHSQPSISFRDRLLYIHRTPFAASSRLMSAVRLSRRRLHPLGGTHRQESSFVRAVETSGSGGSGYWPFSCGQAAASLLPLVRLLAHHHLRLRAAVLLQLEAARGKIHTFFHFRLEYCCSGGVPGFCWCLAGARFEGCRGIYVGHIPDSVKYDENDVMVVFRQILPTARFVCKSPPCCESMTLLSCEAARCRCPRCSVNLKASLSRIFRALMILKHTRAYKHTRARAGHHVAQGCKRRLGTFGGECRVRVREIASATMSRYKGRPVVELLFGTPSDVLRALLDCKQDGFGSQLSCQVKERAFERWCDKYPRLFLGGGCGVVPSFA